MNEAYREYIRRLRLDPVVDRLRMARISQGVAAHHAQLARDGIGVYHQSVPVKDQLRAAQEYAYARKLVREYRLLEQGLSSP